MEAGKHNYDPKQLHERAELLTQQPVCKAEVPRQTRVGHTRYMVKIGVEGRYVTGAEEPSYGDSRGQPGCRQRAYPCHQ